MSSAPVGNTKTRARYRRILRFAAWQLTMTWWYELFLPRIGLEALSARRRSRRMRTFARRFHLLALDLGGLMIKVGQFLSSRLDILPPEITTELEGLQDEVPGVSFAAVQAAIEAELGMPLTRAFDWFDVTPLAAASLGQAHRARLNEQDIADSGLSDVIVKVQRPGIDVIVDVDLAALRRVARWLSRVRLVSDRADAPALVEEFATTSLQEIDYLHEASSAERFAEQFAGESRVGVPRVYWEKTTRRVLVLEDVTAIKISDTNALRAEGIDPGEVAVLFADLMFDQFFTHGFFHADPHPGNIFVTPLPGKRESSGWRLTFIDFGMMGEISSDTRSGLRRLIIAAAARDGKGLVEAMSRIGLLLPSANVVELERALTHVFARFGGMGFAQLREIDPREFREFALEFGEVIRSLPFQLPENFLLVIRAISLVSGVCTALKADFNLWDSVDPYAARLVRDEGGRTLRDALGYVTDYAGVLARLPARLDRFLSQQENNNDAALLRRLEHRVARVQRLTSKLLAAMIFTALLVAGAVVMSDFRQLGVALMIAAVVPLAVVLAPSRRTPRR